MFGFDRAHIASKTKPQSEKPVFQTSIQTDAAHHFIVCVLNAAHIAAETVLIQLLVRFGIPKTAGIRRDFVRQNDSSVRQSAELQLEIDQLHAKPREIFLQHAIDRERHIF